MEKEEREGFGINYRIKSLIKHYNISRYRFARETGISEAVIRNISTIHNKPSVDAIRKILLKYTDIDGNWLITGDGEMFRTSGMQPAQGAGQVRNIDRLIEIIDRLTLQNRELQEKIGKYEQARMWELEKKLAVCQHPDT